jgi:hypothetical protein
MPPETMDGITRSLLASLRRRRFNYQSEKGLQDGVEAALRADGFKFEREFRLGDAGVIDFFVGGFLGIEIKTKGSPSEVARQLLRYAARDEVRVLALVTGRAALSALPTELMGKPLMVVELWRSFL